MKNYYIPQSNIIERKENYEIYLDIPGVNKEDININIENDILTVEAEVKVKDEDKNWKLIFGQTHPRVYKRSFQLNDKIDKENISAEYNDGVLAISIPKAKEAQPKKIAIK